MSAAQSWAFCGFCKISLNFSLPHLFPKETERIIWFIFPKLFVGPLQNAEPTILVILYFEFTCLFSLENFGQPYQ